MRKQHYDRHLLSKKHMMREELRINSSNQTITSKHVCTLCHKSFMYASGLSKHKLKCEPINHRPEQSPDGNNEIEIIRKQLSDQQIFRNGPIFVLENPPVVGQQSVA